MVPPLGVWWYLATLAGAFVWLVGSPLSELLSLSELAAAAIPVGTVCAAWIIYLVACAFGSLGPLTLLAGNTLMVVMVAERYPSFRARLPRLVAALRGVSGERLDAGIAWGITAALAVPIWSLYSSRMLPVGACLYTGLPGGVRRGLTRPP